MKYRVGRKQKRVILDEHGHEVAICHKGKEEVAQKICDLLNEHGLVSKNELLHTKVFNLANELAINGYGDEAVRMHRICNGM